MAKRYPGDPGEEEGDDDLLTFDRPAGGGQGVAIGQLVGDDEGELPIIRWDGQAQGLQVGVVLEMLQGLGPLRPFQPPAAPDGQPS